MVGPRDLCKVHDPNHANRQKAHAQRVAAYRAKIAKGNGWAVEP